MSALSLSTTMMASPASISSPSALSHVTTLPSFMVEDRAGMNTLEPSAFSRVVVAAPAVEGEKARPGLVPAAPPSFVTPNASADRNAARATRVAATGRNMVGQFQWQALLL